MKGATGTSLCGTIEHVSTKRVPCKCWICYYHRDMGKKTKGKYFYCTYYDIFEPKKTCARYYAVPITRRKAKKKRRVKRKAS